MQADDIDRLDDASLLLLDWELRWAERSRQKQRTPPGNWLVWGIQAGRGFGKTETGAQWLGRKAATEPNRYCVIAPTYDDVRRTCFEGESGLFAVIPHQLITARDLGLPMLRLWNGSEIRGFAADTYERLRGPQHAAGWCDEIACLVAGTLVSTEYGPRPIETLRKGDRVWTRKGLKCVCACGVSATSAELWELEMSSGAALVGTGHHPIWSVRENAYVPLQSMRHGDTLQEWQSSSGGAEKLGTCSAAISKIAAACSFIVRSTRLFVAGFRQGRRYTTSTETRRTIESTTFVPSHALSTSDWNLVASLRGLVSGYLSSVELSGSASLCANGAATHAEWLTSLSGSAPSSARSGVETSPTVRRVQPTHVVSVRKLAHTGTVYNLDVDDAHEFYANGVLTHNSWRYPRAAWDMYQMGLRLGRHTQTLWTGTPKPTPFIRDLIKQTDVLVRGATMENRANLAPSFFKQLMKYEGTAIGRQEIYGELLDPEDSGFIKRNQWRLWSSRSALPTFEFIVMSLDTAFTEKTFDKKDQKTDPTACSVWGVFVHENQRHVMLLDCWEDSLGFPQLVERVKKERLNTYGSPETLIHDGRNPVYGRPLYGANKPRGKEIDVTLIEDKGSGISLRQQLASEDVLGVPYNPGRSDKLARLHAVSPMFAAHRVWCVESGTRAGEPRTWAEPLISQVCTYVGEGSVEHDDLLDTTTQALKYISDRFMGGYTLPPKTPQKKLEEDVERRRRQDRVVNFYG